MKYQDEPCCGEHAQPIPTKGHPHAMHFVMLLAGMGLIYSLAGVILLTKISNVQAAAPAPVAVVADPIINQPSAPERTTTSLDVITPTTASVEVIDQASQ